MATEADHTLINRIFDGRYLIMRRLGSGGMAEVYLAEDQELGRKVALKMLNERHARDEQFVERFKREARNAAGLSHPHIVRIYDRGQAEGTYYIAMEYLDGFTLKELLVRKGPTPPMTAVKFAREILSALAEAHRHEIVHRDIKPHNVIVSPNWQIKVTDFGIARSGASQMTEVGSIVGTAQYLSPEQARGAPVDQRSDLYSLGIVLYEMLTGKVPFSGDAAVEIAMKHLTAIPDPPSKLRPDVPRELDAVVMRALAKDPAQRYSSAEEMDADLARVARGAAVSARTEDAMTRVLGATALATAATTVARTAPASDEPVPSAYRPTPLRPTPPPPRRSRWPTAIALLALLIAAAGAYLIYDHVAPILAGSKTVVVPSVIGVQYPGARLTLEQLGLYVTHHTQPDAGVAAGAVISQEPLSGKRVPKHSTVVLKVSSGLPTVVVPPLVGMGQSRAEAMLTHLDLKPKLFFHTSPTVPSGTVTATAPAAGRTIPIESPVTLSISSGPAQVAVPGVVGQPYQNAAGALRGAGFVPVEVSVYSSAPVGQVSSQYPSAGTLEPPNTTVHLYVSKGQQTSRVPNVIGDDERDAYSYLAQQGFSVSVVSESVTLGTQAGLVLKQSPGPGASAPTGTTVTITVGKLITPAAPPATTTPATTTAPTTTPAVQTTPTTAVPTTPATTTPATTTQTNPGATPAGAPPPPATTPAAQTTPTTTVQTTATTPPTTT